MLIKAIQTKVGLDDVEFSKHATDRSVLRRIRVSEVREAIENGRIIEDYPDDKYGPSCLIFGFTQAGRPLHIQCTHPSQDSLKVITLYEPDPDRWIDYETRRTEDDSR